MVLLVIIFILSYFAFILGYVIYYYYKSYKDFKISKERFERKFGSLEPSGDKSTWNKVTFTKITLKDVINCFSLSRNHKYNYLGISWNIFYEGTDLYDYVEEFIEFVDSKAKPWWCPRFVLNLLHLFGDDNSIVRCRNQHLSSVKRRLTKGIAINDIKTKFGTLRIYGLFTQEIDDKLNEVEKKVNPHLKEY